MVIKNDYQADSIKALEGLEAVRKRPGMYIGDTSVRGMHHLIYEVVDNCIDEAMAGYASHISLIINVDGSVSITDDGRGIPVDWHQGKQMSALTVVMTVLHAGGKFDGEAYKISGGLHGVGVSVVNALSEWLEVEVYRNNNIYFQRFEKGIPQSEVETRGTTKRKGTKIVFKPDAEIFVDVEDLAYNYEIISTRIRELAFLNKGLCINLLDEREENKKEIFQYDGGIKSFVKHLNKNKKTIHDDVIYFEKRDEASNVEVEIALQYNDGYVENTLSFANNINTHEGGTHLSGFRSALTRCINTWGKRNKVLKDENLQGDDCREGMAAIISVRLTDPQFEGQTKTKLGNRNIQGITETIINEGLSIYFEENPGIARIIINRAFSAASARLAARKARDMARRKNALTGSNMPGKLADCISKDRETTEVYLVEGDSAGGSAKVGRDNRTQAILPLKGKILNVEKHRLDKVLENKEITSIISALGTGIGGDEFNIDALRYGKIIIMTDADVDGSHIRTLILTFFYRFMPELIKSGHIYVAQPPLYRVGRRKHSEYILSEEEMNKALLKLGSEGTTLEYRDNGSSVSIEGNKFNDLLGALTKIVRLGKALFKRGIDFAEYIKLREEMKLFPKYRGKFKEETKYFISDNELQNFIKEKEKEKQIIEVIEDEFEMSLKNNNEKSKLQDDVDEGSNINTEKLYLTEFVFYKELETATKTVENKGLKIIEYFSPKDPAQEGKFFLCNGSDEIQLKCLEAILEGTMIMGKKGLDIQRYKGLGEMNPDQLWETTMDPQKRTLLQVSIGDVAEADNLFSILMGEVVEPRRAFIEKHAMDVANLDV